MWAMCELPHISNGSFCIAISSCPQVERTVREVLPTVKDVRTNVSINLPTSLCNVSNLSLSFYSNKHFLSPL